MENKLINTENQVITSLELVKQINLFREEEYKRKIERGLELSKYEEKHKKASILRHDNFLRTIRDELDEEIAALKIEDSSYIGKDNKVVPMYVLNIKYGQRLLLRESKYVRRAVVDWIEKVTQKFQDPMALIQQGMAMLNKKFDEQNEEIKKLQEENLKLRPIAQNYRLLFNVQNAIDIGHVATLLAIKKLGRNNLFKKLKAGGIITSDNRPYQKDVESKRFRLIEYQYTKRNGGVGIGVKLVVFQKGLDYIINFLRKEGYIIPNGIKIEDSPACREVLEEKSNK